VYLRLLDVQTLLSADDQPPVLFLLVEIRAGSCGRLRGYEMLYPHLDANLHFGGKRRGASSFVYKDNKLPCGLQMMYSSNIFYVITVNEIKSKCFN